MIIESSCFTYITTGIVSTHCTEQRDSYREKYCGHMQNMCVPIILLFVSTKYSFMHLILVRENKKEAI